MTEVRWCALALTVLLLACARAAAAQTITEFPVPIPAESYTPAAATIAAGPDDALWFSAHGRSKIARITTTGTVTEFLIPVPRRVFVYTDIALGPDGALWFGIAKAPASSKLILGESGSIGRMTTTGEFREFPLPPSYHHLLIGAPNGMTAGPDSALWFTVAAMNKIGRITTAGTISEFLLPTPDGRPFAITAGPDCALWFTETNGNKISRITTAGEFSEFPLPTANGRPFGITAGPDGALWRAPETKSAGSPPLGQSASSLYRRRMTAMQLSLE